MSLRVVTYNVKYTRPHGWSDRLPVIADVIRAQAADVVALQECVNQSDAEWIARELGMDMRYGQGNHRWSEVWLSRLPIERAENYKLDALVHGLLEVQVSWDSQPLRLFNTHLRSLGPQSPLGFEARRRTAEARAILDVLPPSGVPHVLVGDFNSARPREFIPDPVPAPGSAPWLLEAAPRYHHVPYARQPIQLMLSAGYTDCYWEANRRRPRDPRVDFIFASAALAPRLRSCETFTGPGSDVASDHHLFWAEFS